MALDVFPVDLKRVAHDAHVRSSRQLPLALGISYTMIKVFRAVAR